MSLAFVRRAEVFWWTDRELSVEVSMELKLRSFGQIFWCLNFRDI